MDGSKHPKATDRSVATASLPTNLPSRYEIRVLTPDEALWAMAILAHSNGFHNKVHLMDDPDSPTQGYHAIVFGCEYLVASQINSGLSLGVFDLEYEYKRPESENTKGAFYWDPSETNLTSESLLEQMDFPLVSVALARDAAVPWDVRRIRPLSIACPRFGVGGEVYEKQDTRDPKTWKPEAKGEVMMRNASSTRHDYEGKGLASGVARFMMRWAKEKGFRGIQIGTSSDAMNHIWGNPPPPFKGTVVVELKTWEYKNAKGENPYGDRRQSLQRIWVDL